MGLIGASLVFIPYYISGQVQGFLVMVSHITGKIIITLHFFAEINTLAVLDSGCFALAGTVLVHLCQETPSSKCIL